MESLITDLNDPKIWQDPKSAQKLNKEKVHLEREVSLITELEKSIQDVSESFQISVEEDDQDSINAIFEEIKTNSKQLSLMEFQRMFSHPMDPNNAFLDIQSGSGGTEAQDWAEMIMRMYLKWGESKGFKTELIEVSPGEVAGIKSSAIIYSGTFWPCTRHCRAGKW